MSNVTVSTVHTVSIPLLDSTNPEENAYNKPAKQIIYLNTAMVRELKDELEKILGVTPIPSAKDLELARLYTQAKS